MTLEPTSDLSKILQNSGVFASKTKSEAEFVVTRFQEDLAWLSGLEHLATIYNKGSPDFHFGNAEVKSVPNFGAGLETLLRHIISRYDSLAEVTMFCQGGIADRPDQPLYPLEWYFDFTSVDTTSESTFLRRDNDMVSKKGVKGVLTDAYDVPKSRFRGRLTDSATHAVRNRTLREFRDRVVGIPYKYLVEFWVRGDWISVQRDVIRKKPREYYMYLYESCKFGRGIFVEECWFLEHSLYSIFTQNVRRDFTYTSEKEVLLT